MGYGPDTPRKADRIPVVYMLSTADSAQVIFEIRLSSQVSRQAVDRNQPGPDTVTINMCGPALTLTINMCGPALTLSPLTCLDRP